MNLSFYTVTKHKKHETIPFHTHSCHEMVFYSNGCSGSTIIDNEKHIFKAGDLAIISKETMHYENHTSDGELMFFGFEADTKIKNELLKNAWSLKPLFDSIIKEAKEQEFGYEKIISLKISELLTYIERINHNNSPAIKDLSFCKRYIDENYMYRISVEELAKMSGYSYDYFRRLFTESFNISPQKYLIETRITKAVSMLTESHTDCTAIAYMCGFSDSGQMSKLIKAKYNKTPSQIRKSGIYL